MGEHCIPDALLQAEWKKEAVARRVESTKGLSCRLQSSPSSSACVGSVVSRGVEDGRLAAKEHLVKLAATGTKVGRVAVNAFLVCSGVGVELGEVAWGHSERVSRECERVEQCRCVAQCGCYVTLSRPSFTLLVKLCCGALKELTRRLWQQTEARVASFNEGKVSVARCDW